MGNKKVTKTERLKNLRKRIRKQVQQFGVSSLEGWLENLDSETRLEATDQIEKMKKDQTLGSQKLVMKDFEAFKTKDLDFEYEEEEEETPLERTQRQQRSGKIDEMLDKADGMVLQIKEELINQILNESEVKDDAMKLLKGLAKIEKDSGFFDARTYKGLINE